MTDPSPVGQPDAIFVQRNKAGKVVAQPGVMSSDVLPDPESATADQTFDDLADMVVALSSQAQLMEYGFQYWTYDIS